MGINGLDNEVTLPRLHSPELAYHNRRSSLPPLLVSTPRKSLMRSYPEILDFSELPDKNKLPKLNSSKKILNETVSPHKSNDLNPGDLSDNDFSTVECGYEEAGGVGQMETAMLTYKDGQQEQIFYLNLDETCSRARNIDLCGSAGRKNETGSESPQLNEASNKIPAIGNDVRLPEDKVLLTMKGNKAQYQPRPVICPVATSRPVLLDRNRIPAHSTGLHRKKERQDIMASMEERLAKSTKARKNLNKSKSKNKKSKRAKTAGSKTRIRKNLCLLTCIKPQNLEQEKAKFMKSGYTYNPQFKYEFPASESVLARHNKPSSQYIPQALAIIQRVLDKYENYEKFEWATGGQLLTKTQLWNTVKKYLQKEGFYGDVVVNISNDIIARAAMMVTGGRPTLSIRENAAKKLWVEGLLRHEIGTHHLRFHNNRQQIWNSNKVRRQMGLQPANPTEEGLASIHSVLLRKDPALWRSAILYYSVYKASQMSFAELFQDLGKFVESPEVRWDYCLRCKRGQYDTSKPGCFCKDQVYLTGILQLLQVRHTLDFHLLCTMGKVSYEDIEILKPHYNVEHTKIPSFMQDLPAYRERLDHIVEVNGLEKWLAPDQPTTDESNAEL